MSFAPSLDRFRLGSDTDASDEEPSIPVKTQRPLDTNKPQPSTDQKLATPPGGLPGLRSANLFLPIPNTDPLSALLVKYVPPETRPPRDTSGTWTNEDMHTLIVRLLRDLPSNSSHVYSEDEQFLACIGENGP